MTDVCRWEADPPTNTMRIEPVGRGLEEALRCLRLECPVTSGEEHQIRHAAAWSKQAINRRAHVAVSHGEVMVVRGTLQSLDGIYFRSRHE
jgi:hypothetical protein